MINQTGYLDVALQLIEIASIISIRHFRQEKNIFFKENHSPVTNADNEIEEACRQYIQRIAPTHGILGEEYGVTNSDSEYVWVIDPIDGTAPFACGKPTFCTLIALLKNDEPILGIIDQPILRERWVGMKGKPSTHNGIPCLVAKPQSDKIRLNCTTPEMFKSQGEQQFFKNIRTTASVVSYGGDAYAYGLLASGHIDLIVESDLQYYDVAALIPIIEGAQGKITDWEGNLLHKKSFEGKVIACAQEVCPVKSK